MQIVRERRYKEATPSRLARELPDYYRSDGFPLNEYCARALNRVLEIERERTDELSHSFKWPPLYHDCRENEENNYEIIGFSPLGQPCFPSLSFSLDLRIFFVLFLFCFIVQCARTFERPTCQPSRISTCLPVRVFRSGEVPTSPWIVFAFLPVRDKLPKDSFKEWKIDKNISFQRIKKN